VTVVNGDFEFDVCAIHGGLVKYCGECGFATVWKRPEPGAEPRIAQKKSSPKPEKTETEEGVSAYAEEQLDLTSDWGLQPLAEAMPPPGGPTPPATARGENAALWPAERRGATIAVDDRRNRVRAKVNYFACVRSVWR
jgi:hypothetical protein